MMQKAGETGIKIFLHQIAILGSRRWLIFDFEAECA